MITPTPLDKRSRTTAGQKGSVGMEQVSRERSSTHGLNRAARLARQSAAGGGNLIRSCRMGRIQHGAGVVSNVDQPNAHSSKENP